MDFTIPEDLRMMTETIRWFVQCDLEPISRQVEDEESTQKKRLKSCGDWACSV